MAKLENIVEEVMQRQVGNTAILLGYLEHQVDLLSKLVQDLAEIVDTTKITPEVQERLDKLGEVMTNSSIDFDNLEDPMQSYKLPGTVATKGKLRDVQLRYLQAKANRGEL
jgi:hypothetical protein